MKAVLIVCVIAFVVVIVPIGCNQQQQPKIKKEQTETTTPVQEAQRDLPDLDERRRAELKTYLSAEQSEVWLQNNHFTFARTADDRGYIITCNYYDPGPPSRTYKGSTTISDQATASITGPKSALATIDLQGRIRVKPDNMQ